MSSTYGEQITLPGLYVVGDISSSQYKFVRLSTDTANVVLAVSATTQALAGVLQNAPDAANEAAKVAGNGVTVMIAGTSTITEGADLTSDSQGRAITGGAIVGAKALESVSAVGDQFRALLTL